MYEEGEKNTKYFYSLEKAKYNAKTCYQLVLDDGTEINSKDQLLRSKKASMRIYIVLMKMSTSIWKILMELKLK